MFLVDPFLFRIDSIPKYKFTVHSSRSHELQFWHGDHTCDEKIGFLFAILVIFPFSQCFLKVSFKVPHRNRTIFLSAIEDFVYGIPG